MSHDPDQPRPYVSGTIRGFGPGDVALSAGTGCVRVTVAGFGLQFDTGSGARERSLATIDRLTSVLAQLREYLDGPRPVPAADPRPVEPAPGPGPAPVSPPVPAVPVRPRPPLRPAAAGGGAESGDVLLVGPGSRYPTAPAIGGPGGAPGPAHLTGRADPPAPARQAGAPVPLPAGLRCG